MLDLMLVGSANSWKLRRDYLDRSETPPELEPPSIGIADTIAEKSQDARGSQPNNVRKARNQESLPLGKSNMDLGNPNTASAQNTTQAQGKQSARRSANNSLNISTAKASNSTAASGESPSKRQRVDHRNLKSHPKLLHWRDLSSV